jgi:arylsulfatase A-like enzyme
MRRSRWRSGGALSALIAPVLGIAAAASICVSRPAAAPPSRMNVVVILADDLGYGDVSSYGGRLPTPNIDALAAAGVRFTDAYATAAVCAPSRAAMLAGRHQARFGFEFNPVGRDEQTGLPAGETTLADMMRSAGYATALIGKWHIGQGPGHHPLDRGFQRFYGVLGGATSYVGTLAPGDMGAETGADAASSRQRIPIFDGRRTVDPPGYLTDVLTDQAIAYMRENRERPFFLLYAPTAPHTPLQATKRYLDRFPGIADPHARIYAAMVSALDDNVGRLTGELRALGLDRRTLVVFLSDNGCPNYVRGACSNGPLAGYKAFPWEGGVRVPFIASAPGRLPAGAVSGRVVSTLDLMPTLAAAAGVAKPPRAEGASLFAAAGRKAPRDLYWRMGPNYVVRDGRWKLLVANKSNTVQDLTNILGSPVPDGIKAEVSPLGQWTLLFDVEADPGEKRDLAAAHPDVVRRLQRRFEAWDRANIEPMFTSRRQFHAEVDGRRVQLFN